MFSEYDDIKTSATLSVLVFLGLFILAGFTWVYSIFAYGFVLAKLWTWFIIPIASTVLSMTIAKIGVLQAAALMMVLKFMVYNPDAATYASCSNKDESTGEKFSKMFGHFLGALFAPWFVLLFAWILKAMM